jgi:putative aminopeptidase FrvX
VELAKKLCDTYGPSGREDHVRDIIKDELQNYCKNIEVDRLGNVIAYVPSKTGKGDKIMFCAHMDEIGLIVTHIDKNGFLRFTKIGGVFTERILQERVIFENGTIGIIGAETKPETPKPPRLDNMFIDIGAENKEEALTMVKIGDIAAFHQHAITINNRLAAKALDDRIGCYCLIDTIKRIKDNRDDLYFVFSVQEEVGLKGARTGAYAIEPKYAIAVDVTTTGDTPESPKMDLAIGRGVAIKVKDRAFISNPLVRDKLISYAQKISLPYQLEILERGTTDAAVIQLVKAGVLSGVLSIPTRYVHSINECCDFKDVEGTIKLLTYICEKGLEKI